MFTKINIVINIKIFITIIAIITNSCFLVIDVIEKIIKLLLLSITFTGTKIIGFPIILFSTN